MKVPFKVRCQHGDGERLLKLPGKFEVCERCEGHGKHSNPAIDGHGLSREELDEDPEFAEAYFAGRYDIVCEECKGERVVATVELDRLPKALRRRIEDQLDSEAEDRRDRAWEASLRERGIEW